MDVGGVRALHIQRHQRKSYELDPRGCGGWEPHYGHYPQPNRRSAANTQWPFFKSSNNNNWLLFVEWHEWGLIIKNCKERNFFIVFIVCIFLKRWLTTPCCCCCCFCCCCCCWQELQLFCIAVFGLTQQVQRKIRRHNSPKRKAACVNHWPHGVTTKDCYLLMLPLKCQWPIFVKEDTATHLKVDAPSCSECFVKIPPAVLFPESCTLLFTQLHGALFLPECVAHFSTVTVSFFLF